MRRKPLTLFLNADSSMATDAQIAILQQHGMSLEIARKLTKDQASVTIGVFIQRQRECQLADKKRQKLEAQAKMLTAAAKRNKKK